MPITLMVLLAYHPISGSTETIKVLQTDENISSFVPNSGAWLISEIPDKKISNVTVCFHFFVNQFIMYNNPPAQNLVEFNGMPVFGITYDFRHPSDPNIQQSIGERWKNGSVFGYYFHKNAFSLFALRSVLPRKWNNVCFISHKNYFKVFVNSQFIYEENIQYEMEHSNIVIMGSTMAQPKGTFAGSFFGKITDFNVWNYDVDDEDILKWTTCENNKKGNLVDWNTSKWKVKGLKETFVEKQELCQQEEKTHFIMSNLKRDFDSTLLLCTEMCKLNFKIHY